MPYADHLPKQIADALAMFAGELKAIRAEQARQAAALESLRPAPNEVSDKVRAEVLGAIFAAFADGNWTAAEVLARAGQDDAPADQLAYALAPVLGKGRDPARVLGKYLGRIKDTAADGWTLIQIDTRAGNGSALWSVRRVRGV